MNPPQPVVWAPFILQTLVATLLSGSIVGFALKSLVDGRMERVRFTRAWKEESLSKVVGPVVMHLARTASVSARYQRTYSERTTSYFDAKLMRDSNEAVRAILLSNGHLIPVSLRGHAQSMVNHYDVWLGRFDAKVDREQPSVDSLFDVGFAEISFPREAAEAFQISHGMLLRELYGVTPI